jgi:hypothetical protein
MARICTVCCHAKRQEIDRALVGGVPTLKVAGQYKLARTSVRRYQASHLVEKMARAAKSRETRDVVGPVKVVEEAELVAFHRKLSQRGHVVFGAKARARRHSYCRYPGGVVGGQDGSSNGARPGSAWRIRRPGSPM